MKGLLSGVLLTLTLASLSFAQRPASPPPPKPAAPKPVDPKVEAERLAKQITLADQVIADAAGLRLGENRAFVFARVGGLLWKSDPKSAQSMFQRSVNDMAAAQMQAEIDDRAKPGREQNAMRIGQSIRPVILDQIGRFDPEFALESLYRTRTESIQRAMAQGTEQSLKIGESNGMSSSLASTEFNLEQRLIRLAAEKNPELAVKLLQESIKKGLSNETLALLKKLFEKDPETANSLATDTMDRLMSASFSVNIGDQSTVNLAMTVLNDTLREKKPGTKELKFEEMSIRSLANKLITHYLGQEPRMTMGRLPQLIKIAERYSPATVAALKKLEKSARPPGMGSMGGMAMDSDTRKLIDSNLTPAQLTAEAKKLPADTRGPVYQSAANKMSQAGDYSGAMELLSANFTGGALENAVNGLNWYYADVLMNQGKFPEAERLIDEMPENNRRAALISLAKKAFTKNPAENKEYAATVLRKVRSMLPDRPTSQMELMQFMQLSSTYSGIDDEEAFSTIEPTVPLVNEVLEANVVVQGFQGGWSVRSGELIMVNGPNLGVQFDPNLFRMLAKADFDRTEKLINSLSRREMRIIVRLQLAESGLN